MSVCATAAIAAAGEAHGIRLRAGQLDPNGGEGAEPPVTDLLPMLEAISCAGTTEAVDPGLPANPISAETMRMLMAIETLASGNPHAARRDSLAGLAERDRARDGRTASMRPSAMQGAELAALINQLTDRLAA
jgi:hypothetical protein